MIPKTLAHNCAGASLRPRATIRPNITMPAASRNGLIPQNVKSQTNNLSLGHDMNYLLMTSYSPMNPGAIRQLLRPRDGEDLQAHGRASMTKTEIDCSKVSVGTGTVKRSGIASTLLSSTMSLPKATEHTTTPLEKIAAKLLGAATMDGKPSITKRVPATTTETKTQIPARPWFFELPTPLRPCKGTTYYTSLNTEHSKCSSMEHAKPNIFQYILYGMPAPEERMTKNSRIAASIQKILYGVHEEDEHNGMMKTVASGAKASKVNA